MEIKELNGVLYYSGVGLPDNNVRPEVESVFFYINEETQKKYVWTINRISGVGSWIELGDTLKFIIFDELPEPSEEYSTTIALILNSASQESDDEYDEYACVYNNELSVWKWEKLNSHVRFWSNYYYDADGKLILSKQDDGEIVSLTIGDPNESRVNVNIVGETLTFNGGKIIDDNDVSTSSTYSSAKIESIVDGIHQKITDDEEVVSAALNDLKIDIDRIESECEGAIKSITVNGTRVEADSDHNVELTAGTLTLTDADNKTLGLFTANSTTLIQIPEATSSEYGFVKVDNTLDSTSTNPVENRVISSAISSLVGIRCEVVSELPPTGENGVIYFVPNGGSEQNIYDEYIWIDSTSKFELIGTTEVDLSNYVTNDDLNAILLNYVSETDLTNILNNYVTDSEFDTLIEEVNTQLSDIEGELSTKQDQLTAGSNITISNNGVISANVPTVGDGNLNIKINQSGTVSPVSGFNANQDSDEDIIFSAGSNVTLSASGNTITISSTGGGVVGTLDTTNTTSLTPQSGESLSGTIGLHKISKTGSYNDLIGAPSLASVATSGSYNDLSNKPTIPAAQVNADWNASSGVSEILHKPSFASVATSGSYDDLINKPTIPTVGDGSLHIKVNQSGSETDVICFSANQGSSDNITFVAGSNITLTPNTTNKTITIAATGGTSGINITVPSDDATYPILLGNNTNAAESNVTSIKKSVGLVVNPLKKSVAEGNGTAASGSYSHAEGENTTASNQSSHAEGSGTTASGTASHAEGTSTTTIGVGSHTEGFETRTEGYWSHAEGRLTQTIAGAQHSHAEGNVSIARGAFSHAEGTSTNANGEGAHAEGLGTFATGNWSHAEGNGTNANGAHSHAEGNGTTASGAFSHAEGTSTSATVEGAHAEGQSTTASGIFSHAEGQGSQAHGSNSHAEGENTTASNQSSHAEGSGTTASGTASHAEGQSTTASKPYSHAEGFNTTASGWYSHASGQYTIANRESQTVVGQYNDDTLEDALFVVGNGTSTSRSNAFYVKDDGSVYASGAYYAASDKRKKDIIGDIDLEKAYSLLETCQTVIYTWKDDESKKQQIGVIAQEIQQFFPEMVNEDEHGMLSVDYSRLTVILMSVIKNNVKEMKSLEERIKLLEKKINK